MTENVLANTPDQHLCVLAGRQTLFACHLGMFADKNHMYQVILEIGLPQTAWAQFSQAREKQPDATFFLINVDTDRWTLPQVCTGQISSSIVNVSIGSPSNPPLLPNVRARIQRVVYFRPIDFSDDYPSLPTYLLFGAGSEAFITHVLTKDPDFQHVASLKSVPSWLPPQQLEMGVHVNFNDVKLARPVCQTPLDEKAYKVLYQGLPDVHEVTVGKTVFFTGSGWNSKNPCPDT